MNLLSDDFGPSSTDKIREKTRSFAEDVIQPKAQEIYEEGRYPMDILKSAMDENIVAQDISEEYGGSGYDIYQNLAIAEELFRVDAGIGLTIQLASFGSKILEKYGREDLKYKYLRPVAENESITGLAVSEPDTGSNLAGMKTKAEKNDNEWVINGEKYWIGNGKEADWITLYAKTDNKDDRYNNYSLFVVPTDKEGYNAEHIPEKKSFRGSKQSHVKFDDLKIPEDHLIGTEGAGFYMLAEFFNYGRIVVAGHGIGLAAAAIEEASSFTHNRESFDRKVSEFQKVQHKLADMLTEFESSRSLTWKSARKVDNGNKPGKWAAMAKTKATDASVMCARNAMDLYGGRSVLKENKISRIHNDVRVPVIYEGANDIQRNLIYKQTDW